MPGYLRRHVPLLAIALALLVSGCASSSPRVTVLGVEQAHKSPRRSLLVFVEVVNPSSRDLRLSRLEYKVRADSWFESQGQVSVERDIGAGSSAVVEISVPVQHADGSQSGNIPYTLEGKLFALEDKIERSWNVAVRGAIGRNDRTTPVRVTAVDAN
jgi:hypothetical protein